MELTHTARREGRLSSLLLRELKMSQGLIHRLKWQSALLVNGVPRHTDYPVQIGDVISVRLEEAPPEYPAQDGEISVLMEDEWLLAVDKPAGMLIHPSRAKNEGTLANYVAGYYRRTGQQSAFHPLTRLDRDTFGAVLLAKSAHIHALLQAAHPEKTYEALVWGMPDRAQGEITAPISRCELPSLLRRIDPEGKPCRTVFQVLEQGEGWSRLELHPVTGRTHQLRLHCAFMGCPILGDPQYGSAESTALSRKMGIHTQLLWARQIDFSHPLTGAPVTVLSRLAPKIPHA